MLRFEQLNTQGAGNFFLIAGPCVVENERIPLETGRKINDICKKLDIPFIFKSSYKKANRSRLDSFTGIGDVAGLQIIRAVGEELKVPVLTDFHSAEEAYLAAEYVDVLQIPAFLCRQTDILVAAAKTGKIINVKKGQFLSAGAMEHVVRKIRESGNRQVFITERGSMFGYHDLVVDYRGIPEMKGMEVPVVLDCTHSLQQPNQPSGVSGGLPGMIETIAKAGIAVGVDGIFIETHPDPSQAKSDGANMLRLDLLPDLLEKLIKIRKAVISFNGL